MHDMIVKLGKENDKLRAENELLKKQGKDSRYVLAKIKLRKSDDLNARYRKTLKEIVKTSNKDLPRFVHNNEWLMCEYARIALGDE